MVRLPLSIVDFYQPEAPFATEFRRLLYKILDRRSDSELKGLLITSAMLSEGKSTVASFLALTAAKHKGLKTLLIDSDLRRPTIHRCFALERQRGLADILSASCEQKDVVKTTPVEKLHVITAGLTDVPPAELFDGEAVGRLIDEMKYYYDLVLVDSAPVLPVSDPMLLAPKLDATLLVVKAGSTQRQVVRRAVDIIGPHKLLGVVVNNVDGSLPYYYDYGYYGYSYRPQVPKEHSRRKLRGRKNPAPRRKSADPTAEGVIRR